MCFEMQVDHGKVKQFYPYYWRNDYAGVEQFSIDPGTRHVHQQLVKQHIRFAALWSRNLEEQGFLGNLR